VSKEIVRLCRGMRFALCLTSLTILSCSTGNTTDRTQLAPSPPVSVKLEPHLATERVPDDPDDPAIWIHPEDPAQSIIVGTNKVEKPGGGLVVFDLHGKIIQSIRNLDRPNNVDIEQRVILDGKTVDIAVVTERQARAVRIYTIDPRSRTLSEIAVLPVFTGEQGDSGAPMGVGIYKRMDETVFVIVGRKTGPTEGYLWQYRLVSGPELQLVRKFGAFSGRGEIESVVVDDALGYVYYADETAGIRKYHADPDAVEAQRELALFGQAGYLGDREGLAIYAMDDRTGYLVSTDQIEGESRYFLYRREGGSGGPHDHTSWVAVFESFADSTDGIDVAVGRFTAELPLGMIVAMNSRPRNFLMFAWPKL
jgi:3-phytase